MSSNKSLHPVVPYLRLARPANVVTAMADVLAGIAISGLMDATLLTSDTLSGEITTLLKLVVITSFLYAAGVIFNDVFDYKTDLTERPERPLPSGEASLDKSIITASILYFIALLLSWTIGWQTLLCAAIITALSFTYNSTTKNIAAAGPVNMGLCRGFNLLLGMSATEINLFPGAIVFLLPVIYIASITLISQEEVKALHFWKLKISLLLYSSVLLLILSLSIFTSSVNICFIFCWLFFGYSIITSLLVAIKEPSAETIRKAVKSGVINLILLDATLASGNNVVLAVIILLLLPVSRLLAKKFAVT